MTRFTNTRSIFIFFKVLDCWFYLKMLTNLTLILFHSQELSQTGQNVLHDPSHDERVRQYAEVSLKGELLEKGWCTLVPQQLKSSEHDHREKVRI